jgi:hypothetical protein
MLQTGGLGQSEGMPELSPSLDPELGDVVGKASHSSKRTSSLGRSDGTSGVKDVERVRALEHLIVGGNR